MTRVPQEPRDHDIDDFISQLEQQTMCAADRACLLTQLEFSVLRRHLDSQRRQLRDRDYEILDLRDRLGSGGAE